MARVQYPLGSIELLTQLYPSPQFIAPQVVNYAGRKVRLPRYSDVIRHYTESSLFLDGFRHFSVKVENTGSEYQVTIAAAGNRHRLKAFSEAHRRALSMEVAGKALAGMTRMKELGVWNPMSGFPVNDNPVDGSCKWSVFPPLGMGIINQRAVMLLHYPPWQALVEASYLNNMTLQRWQRLLNCAGIPEKFQDSYKTILDVNPVAAPGSGQSEYPNDYFPIMMSSAFFDGGSGYDYIRSSLEFLLNPPHAQGNRMTLPLLIGGSPLYDPQAPGWFRVAFKKQMPVDKNGIPQANVMQTGTICIREGSKRKTPYMITNHMIAAGVTGQCTGNAAEIPDIRKYEAQDLVAASFLYEYAKNPDIDPAKAKASACQRWFGNSDGSGAPVPPAAKDKLTLCALAQMDLFFVPTPLPHPKYTMEQALRRCAEAGAASNPCAACIAPAPPADGA